MADSVNVYYWTFFFETRAAILQYVVHRFSSIQQVPADIQSILLAEN